MSAELLAYDENALREMFAAILREPNDNCVILLRLLQGASKTQATRTLAEIGDAGGAFASEAAKLADRRAAHDFARGILAKFAPFADILREALPRGVWVSQKAHGYELNGIEDGRRIARERRVERLPVSYKAAAKLLHIEHDNVRHYVEVGHLKTVAVGGCNLITRESIDEFRKWLKGVRFTETGGEVRACEYMTRTEVCAALECGVSVVRKYANDGQLVRVYNFPDRFGMPCGYTTASVHAFKLDREAEVLYTARGKVHAAERVSRDEARKRIGRRTMFIAALADAGLIERVYLDPTLKRPYGYTRQSVVAYLQGNPRHIPAHKAVAVADFKIEELPPPPRTPRLCAAVLEPAEDCAKIECETAHRETATRKRRIIVFKLSTITETQEEASMQDTKTDTAAPAESKGDKLQVAKAYTIHEGGVIRAICVSEDDRDEITEALAFWRKFKGRESEIESAVALLRVTKKALHIDEADATAGQP